MDTQWAAGNRIYGVPPGFSDKHVFDRLDELGRKIFLKFPQKTGRPVLKFALWKRPQLSQNDLQIADGRVSVFGDEILHQCFELR
jgi:hypothetical protein